MPSGAVMRSRMYASSGDARRLLDHAAEDVGVVAVDPCLAGLRDERQRAEPLHRVADRLILVGGVPAEARGGAKSLRFVERRDRRLRAVRNAGGVRQQIANRDRRRAGTCVTTPRSFATATVVRANDGMQRAGARD